MKLPDRLSGRAVPGILGAILLALVVTSAALWSQARVTFDDGAVAVAKEEAANFFSLDHRSAEKDVDRVLELATGKLKEEYAGQRDKVVASATKEQLVSSATVPTGGTAVEFFGDDKAQVLVGLDVTSSAKGTKEQSKRVRLRVTLERVDGAWLASAIEEVR